MSSKKQLRRKRREQRAAAAAQRKGLNPATAFILAVVAAILVIGVLAVLTADDVGDPPRPGMVWSEEHGHWH